MTNSGLNKALMLGIHLIAILIGVGIGIWLFDVVAH